MNQHRLYPKDIEARTATCAVCGPDTPIEQYLCHGVLRWRCTRKHQHDCLEYQREARKSTVKHCQLCNVSGYVRGDTCSRCALLLRLVDNDLALAEALVARLSTSTST